MANWGEHAVNGKWILCAAGNLAAALTMVAVVSYAGIFSAPGNSAAVGIAVAKTSLPFGKARI